MKTEIEKVKIIAFYNNFLSHESDFDLDNLLRQQELIERQRIEMEAEEIEHHNGMRM